MVLLVLAVLPGLALLYYFHRKDYQRPEPWRHIWITLILSALFVIPVAFIEIGLSHATGLSEEGSHLSVLVYSMFIVSLVEESSKLLALRVYAYRKPEFDERIDGLVYGAASGAGFAILENIFYVMDHGIAVGVLRAFLSVPLHVFTGVLIGYGLIRLKLDGTYVRVVLLFSLSVAVHGAYDHVIFTLGAESPGMSLLISAVCVILLLGFARYYAEKYKTTVQNEEKPSVFFRFFWIVAGILNLFAGAFVALGTLANYNEGKIENLAVYVILIMVPAVLGIYCLFRSRRYAML
jgi:RsiW-degrading membrane proteinase PrsW (M82 family)